MAIQIEAKNKGSLVTLMQLLTTEEKKIMLVGLFNYSTRRCFFPALCVFYYVFMNTIKQIKLKELYDSFPNFYSS